jgi:integrase/recombinase XerD
VEKLVVEDARLAGAAGRVRSSLFGAHLDALMASLTDLGHRPSTIGQKLEGIAELSRWMFGRQLPLAALDEQRLDEFVDALRGGGHNWRGVRPALVLLLDQLRAASLVPSVEPAREDSPAAAVLSRYEDYLRRERALAASTIAGYLALVGPFVAGRFAGPGGDLASLTADEVRDFLLGRTRSISPRYAQVLARTLVDAPSSDSKPTI